MHVPWGIVMMAAIAGICLANNAAAQDVITDQVFITSGHGELFGLTSSAGVSRKFLAAGEDVLVIESKGVTGFVLTSTRLLGFSGRLKRWGALTLATGEQIIKWTVTPRMVVVQGREAVYGFHSHSGRWKKESLGAGEAIRENVVDDHVGVMVTNRRVLGFSALIGGFFSRDILSGKRTDDIEINDNVAVIHFGFRKLVFRSGLAIWVELP